MKIYLESGDYGTYRIVSEDGQSILVQTDFGFPSVASTFGWDGDEKDIEGAVQFLDNIVDTDIAVDDPGYFDNKEESPEEEDPFDDEYGFSMEDDLFDDLSDDE